jgi:hypothetical protein
MKTNIMKGFKVIGSVELIDGKFINSFDNSIRNKGQIIEFLLPMSEDGCWLDNINMIIDFEGGKSA